MKRKEHLSVTEKYRQDRQAKKIKFKKLGTVLFGFGTVIMITSLVFVLLNLERADQIRTVWLPFMGAGVMLSFVGGFVQKMGK